MPYINQKNRKEVKKQLDEMIKHLEKKGLVAENKDVDGILNYIICNILLSVYNKKHGYANYNRMMGVIECIKQELYRRVISPYEDKKIKEHGDII